MAKLITGYVFAGLGILVIFAGLGMVAETKWHALMGENTAVQVVVGFVIMAGGIAMLVLPFKPKPPHKDGSTDASG